MAKNKAPAWYNERRWALALSLVALIATYFMASRSIDTGSLQQYFLTIVLFIIAINRALKAIRG